MLIIFLGFNAFSINNILDLIGDEDFSNTKKCNDLQGKIPVK